MSIRKFLWSFKFRHSEEETKKKLKVVDYLKLPFDHKPAHALSGGQKKQVSIADILVMKLEIIILDEPWLLLDPKYDYGKPYCRSDDANGITVLMVTHDVNYAYEWADEILLFHEGKF